MKENINWNKKDKSYNRYSKYEHIYCKGCGHSMYFITNHPATCGICGTLVYPSKKSEFKAQIEKLKRKKEKEDE